MSSGSALVTGGAGFIGSHIVDALLEKDFRVCVVDDLSTGSEDKLGRHRGDPRLSFVKGDIRRLDEIEVPSGVEVVFHEAAIASVPRSVDDPMGVHEVNVDGSLRVMEFCRRRGVKRFVFASSAAVYGPVASPPAKETDLCSPASPYGASKLAVEEYMRAYRSSYGLETVALRYFNVYGPRQRMDDGYSGVIPLFARQLRDSIVPTVFGDGLQTRDFVSVRDVAAANMLAMESSEASGEAINVASGRQVTILEVLEALAGGAGKGKVAPKFAPARKGDLRVGDASIEKARALLRYSPSVRLEEGLSEVLAYVIGERASVVGG